MQSDSSIIKRGQNCIGVGQPNSDLFHTLTCFVVEEKYQADSKPTNGEYGDKYDEDSESSSDEDEDDEGFLATEALDAEISATLQAIRSKDPRVYDEKVTFYTPMEENADGSAVAGQKQKPMFLRDYHRENLLKGNVGVEDEDETAPKTYAQEQEDLKKSIVKEMHAAADDNSISADDDGDGDFLVPKSRPQLSNQGMHPSRQEKLTVDVKTADKDPETFLSNFMAARAWVPTEGSRFQPLESDDEEEDERAESFEEAYNLRFEDPKGSNEVLKSYARDIIAAKSVRREEPNSRKKQRDLERQRKADEKVQKEEERARLRRLKIEEMEGKLQKIKRAAGIRGRTLRDEEWAAFLDEGWDDDKWEAEMKKQFGDNYYAEEEVGSEEVDAGLEGGSGKKKRKIKKPKWDDDIDITDLVPEFEDEEKNQKMPAFTLSASEEEEEAEDEVVNSSKDKRQHKQAKKKEARLARKKIEELVDNRLDIDLPLNSKKSAGFRYRETSPVSFGLTAKDILMAPDAALNQFAGLKKMASFRDAEKKRKDKRNLGKKARLRQWRRETFGKDDEPEFAVGDNSDSKEKNEESMNIVEGNKKKKRSRKNKGKVTTNVKAA
jgi:protein KRI1